MRQSDISRYCFLQSHARTPNKFGQSISHRFTSCCEIIRWVAKQSVYKFELDSSLLYLTPYCRRHRNSLVLENNKTRIHSSQLTYNICRRETMILSDAIRCDINCSTALALVLIIHWMVITTKLERRTSVPPF